MGQNQKFFVQPWFHSSFLKKWTLAFTYQTSVCLFYVMHFKLNMTLCFYLNNDRSCLALFHKDTYRKIRKTELIHICGSKKGSSSSAVNTREV